MTIRVLIVDDSRFFRKRLAEMIASDPELELAGEAENGRDAVLRVRELKPDLVTMDVEMPVMNGIEAVREIMKVCPTPVLMFSSLTEQGAKATLDALEAGAMDFMPKCFDDILKNKKESVEALIGRMRELGRAKGSMHRFRPHAHTSQAHASFSGHSSVRTEPRSASLASGLSPSSTQGLGARASLRTTTSLRENTLLRDKASIGADSRTTTFTKNGLEATSRTSSLASRLNRITSSATSQTLGAEGLALANTTKDTTSISERMAAIRTRLHSPNKTSARGASALTSNLKESFKENAKESSKETVNDKAPTSLAYNRKFAAIFIGSSTGGPLALQTVLTALPADLPVPVVVVQHMPGSFTGPFAERLDELCALKVTEAKDGDQLVAGHVYVAPGGMQMLVESSIGNKATLKIVPSPAGINYKPCVDITFGSAAQAYRGRVLASVLTGMGADGRKGSSLLRAQGATILAQNEETCVIYGMPKAVVEAGLADYVLPIDEIAPQMGVELTKEKFT